MLNDCEAGKLVNTGWFCAVQTGCSAIKLEETEKTMKGFYTQA
jgi:hypothetical protein